ncbi:MAG: beta-propeller fold lactonase family protein [Deltaproteobacteria bacterium]|nr:beta-propeller fold lactonase family protein [Deltaproteobacteria bacterium]
MKFYPGGLVGRRLAYFLSWGPLITLCASLVSCSSTIGDPGTAAITTSTVAITATVNSPTSSSGRLSILGLELGKPTKQGVTQTAASGLTGTLYTLEGTNLGTAAITNGSFVLSPNLSSLKPSGITGTTWTTSLILVATNETGTIQIETYVEATITEGNTSQISLGTADIETTLASAALQKKIGCDWGGDCRTPASSLDPACYFRAMETASDQGDRTGEGLQDDMGLMKDMIQGVMARGSVTPAGLGYSSWSGVIKKALSGELSNNAISQLCAAASSTTGMDASACTSGYSNSAEAMEGLEEVIGTQLASDVGVEAVSSFSALTTASGSACDSIKNSANFNYTESLIGVILASSSPTTLEKTFSRTGMKVFLGLVEQYQNAGEFDLLQDAPEGIAAFLEGVDSFDLYFAGDGKLADAPIEGLYTLMNGIDASLTPDQRRDWGMSLEGLVNSVGGWNGMLKENGELDLDKLSYFDQYVEEGLERGTFDPDSANFASLGGVLESDFENVGENTSFRSCLGRGGTLESCGGSYTAGGVGVQQQNDNQVDTFYFAYAPNVMGNNISAYRLDATTGALTALSSSPFGAGSVPQRIAITPNSQCLYVNNQNNSSVLIKPITASTGALEEGSSASTGTTPWSSAVTPNGSFLYMLNYVSDDISGYSINGTTCALTPISGSPFVDSPAGDSPSEPVVHPNGKFLYVSNYDDGNISIFEINSSTGALTRYFGSPYPLNVMSLRGMAITPDGNFLYVVDDGTSTVWGFSVNASTGALNQLDLSPSELPNEKYLDLGDNAGLSDITIDPTGKFLYTVDTNDSNGLRAFAINTSNGFLTQISTYAVGGTTPTRVRLDPTGKFLYVVNPGSNNISGFTVNSSTGALTAISGSPFSAGSSPFDIRVISIAR